MFCIKDRSIVRNTLEFYISCILHRFELQKSIFSCYRTPKVLTKKLDSFKQINLLSTTRSWMTLAIYDFFHTTQFIIYHVTPITGGVRAKRKYHTKLSLYVMFRFLLCFNHFIHRQLTRTTRINLLFCSLSMTQLILILKKCRDSLRIWPTISILFTGIITFLVLLASGQMKQS